MNSLGPQYTTRYRNHFKHVQIYKYITGGNGLLGTIHGSPLPVTHPVSFSVFLREHNLIFTPLLSYSSEPHHHSPSVRGTEDQIVLLVY